MADHPLAAALERAYAAACEAEKLARQYCVLSSADRVSEVRETLHDLRLEVSPATREDYIAEAEQWELWANGSRERAKAL